ncbi:hypothetical protein [Methylobacterium aerolatum]|uniref:UrcA family protein n=1 Tax=Methylobacterium aerolatum TaxID=418708 RepID=A0ABU0HZL4_9HYPH|nr:hypothetical protein [Methylobacterium aerolatum]MDQ0447771.1 hypothetical protein [Methylobacterium aerolatum]GJD34869.1 hypothetical protein FMGBMHLM_1776 [Methylobacterium aerolatum]
MPIRPTLLVVALLSSVVGAAAQGGDGTCARDVVVAQSMQRQAIDQLEQADLSDQAKSCRVWRRHVDTMRRVAAVYGRCLSGSDRTTGLAQVQTSEKEFAQAIRERCKGE